MYNKYAVLISEATMPLVTFLNDGVPPEADPDTTSYLICTIESPREISTTINPDFVAKDDTRRMMTIVL